MADWRMPVWFVARWRGDDVPNERWMELLESVDANGKDRIAIAVLCHRR
jgi:hypothetical protein